MSAPQVQLLLTGNELMTGDIVDSNSALIANILKESGLSIKRKVTVADDLPLLISEINYMTSQSDILIINGGLGPTIDDMTSKALAKVLGVKLTEHIGARKHIEDWCLRRGTELNAPNLKQAILPENCHIIPNKNGSAVGIFIRHNNCDVYCTPGVPHELQTMLIEEIHPSIKQKLPADLIAQVIRLQVFGLGESYLQKLIDSNLPDWPSDIELGFRAGEPLLEVKLSTQTKAGKTLLKEWQGKLSTLLGDHLIAQVKDKPQSLANHVQQILQKRGLSITTAESCTGGLIASKITAESGSSNSFEAGFVTYSNKMKTHMLSVPASVIEQYGAVSEAVVYEMATGALQNANADIAIAVSGIAGPNGGTEDKPVGTVWIAWGNENEIKTQSLLLPYNRNKFQHMVTAISLDLVRRYLLNLTSVPRYIEERAFLIKSAISQQ